MTGWKKKKSQLRPDRTLPPCLAVGITAWMLDTNAYRSLRGQACLRMWQSVGLLLFKRFIFNPLTHCPLTPTTSWDQTSLNQCGCSHGKLVFFSIKWSRIQQQGKVPVIKIKCCNILKSDFSLFTHWQEWEAKTIKKFELKIKSNLSMKTRDLERGKKVDGYDTMSVS